MNSEIKNAQIIETRLGYQDHGIFTCTIQVQYGDNSVQGCPALNLRGDNPGDSTGSFLRNLLGTLEAATYEEVKGRYCRVKIEGGLIKAIGHLMKPGWFDLTQNLTLGE